MKTNLLFALLLMAASFTAKAQTITLQNVNIAVICCADSDSIDVGNNGQYDIKVKSMFEGIDSFNFNVDSMQNNIRFYNNGVAYSTVFLNYWYPHGLIAQTYVGCSWSTMYPPGSGIQYQGFRIINSPGDTTYGWIKMNFVGDYGCNDTVYINQIGYSATPNYHVTAGETSPAAVEEIPEETDFTIFPNPVCTQATLKAGIPLKDATITIDNCLGQTVSQIKNVSGASAILSLSNLPDGMYFIRLSQDDRITGARKIVVAEN